MYPLGKFITVEGIDGSGKSTQIEFLYDYLTRNHFKVLVSREPGGTPLAEKIRELLLNESMNIQTELLLMFAARADHFQRTIQPALAQGIWVLCDRFVDSTYAYQGYGRNMPIAEIELLEKMTIGNFKPDLTFLFDIPAEVATKRVFNSRTLLDRFEREKTAFFNAVRKGFLARAHYDPERIKIIDSTQEIMPIQTKLVEYLYPFMQCPVEEMAEKPE